MPAVIATASGSADLGGGPLGEPGGARGSGHAHCCAEARDGATAGAHQDHLDNLPAGEFGVGELGYKHRGTGPTCGSTAGAGEHDGHDASGRASCRCRGTGGEASEPGQHRAGNQGADQATGTTCGRRHPHLAPIHAGAASGFASALQDLGVLRTGDDAAHGDRAHDGRAHGEPHAGESPHEGGDALEHEGEGVAAGGGGGDIGGDAVAGGFHRYGGVDEEVGQ
ncbi:hypothetical protein ACQPXH_21675 [Nocardia sp. CA-135953]|uniref:hypothetical protein n=1 Tax=Nocardia sp. CA-135953 TaxID=3239978 RepID=UPI003D9840CE